MSSLVRDIPALPTDGRLLSTDGHGIAGFSRVLLTATYTLNKPKQPFGLSPEGCFAFAASGILASLMRYKVNVNLQATASIELEAASPEAARLAAAELTLPDLARQGQADILSLRVIAKEITPMASLSGEEDAVGDNGPRRPRPSGWYRPL